MREVYPQGTWDEIREALPRRADGSIRQRAFQLGVKRRLPAKTPPKVAILAKMRQVRQEMGLSQQDVAEMAGVCKATIRFWETGFMMPRLDSVVKWADALEVELVLIERHELADNPEQTR